MADPREQLNVKVTPTTKTLLANYCQEQRTTQSDVVEAALRAFLQPKDGEDMAMVMVQLLHGIADKQTTLEQGVQALVPLLTSIVEQLETTKEEPAVPIARYEQLYEVFRQAPVPEVVEPAPDIPLASPAPRAGWWRRIFAARMQG